ncbi:MAG: non-homologous end-joining DNA ligase [Bradyrhizobium sp.]|uniref:non-homologous end-joining DNA ligase n=1 Tax=Bradyrhizobium sp. TaxID=376 RepID=UPI003D14EDEA
MRLPRFIKPHIPTLVETPPSEAGWVHEIKHDGYRTMVAIGGGEAVAWTRRGHDWSARYRHVLDDLKRLPAEAALIDGEMVVQDEAGVADFNALQNVLQGNRGEISFIAFDLLHLDGADLRDLPLLERKQHLRRLLGRRKLKRAVYSEHMEGDGREVFQAAAAMGLEGIVSKLADSRYRSGPSRSWLKVKAMLEEDFVILGTETGKNGIPYAVLARDTPKGLVHVGRAMISMTRADRDRLFARLERIRRDSPPMRLKEKGKVSWVEPEVRVMVKHLRGADKLRHGAVRSFGERASDDG